jgi:hypothetical protein
VPTDNFLFGTTTQNIIWFQSGSIPIHPNDPSHQYTFPLNQSTVRCPTLDDVPTYANTYLLLFTFEIKIEFAPVSLKTK